MTMLKCSPITFVPCRGLNGCVFPVFTCSHSGSPFQCPYLPQSRHLPVFFPAALVPDGTEDVVNESLFLPLPLLLPLGGLRHPLDFERIFLPARMNCTKTSKSSAISSSSSDSS